MADQQPQSLEEKLGKLVVEANKISDETIRDKVFSEIEKLRRDMVESKKPTEPIYFESETDLLNAFYEKVGGESVIIDGKYKIRYGYEGERKKILGGYCKKILGGYYSESDIEESKANLKERLRQKVLSIAGERGYPAVLITEEKQGPLEVVKHRETFLGTPLFLGMPLSTPFAKITFRASADVFFYRKK